MFPDPGVRAAAARRPQGAPAQPTIHRRPDGGAPGDRADGRGRGAATDGAIGDKLPPRPADFGAGADFGAARRRDAGGGGPARGGGVAAGGRGERGAKKRGRRRARGGREGARKTASARRARKGFLGVHL